MVKTYQEELDRKDAIRRNALIGRNAKVYTSLSNELGISETDIEDIDLYHQGIMELGFERDTQPNEQTRERVKWSNLTLIALARFPELQKGERIGDREIKRRLGQIRDAGYDIKPYSKMTQDEAFTYLMGVRSEITKNARKYCPATLEKVARANEEARVNVYRHR